MELKRKRGRPRKINNKKQGTTENNGKQKMKLEITDSSFNNQVNVDLVRSTAEGKDLVVPVMSAKGEEQAYQALAGSTNPCIFSTEMSQERTEKIWNSVSSKGCTDDIQASNSCEQRANKNRSMCIAGHNLTEMMSLWKDEDDEVDSGLQSLPVDTNDEYQVTAEALPILRKILNKYGDIASNCDLVKYRSTFVQDICDIITNLQDKDLSKTNEDWLQDKIDRVGEIKKMKVDVEWLHVRLQKILEARQSLKHFRLLKEEEEHNKKTIKECEEEEKKLAAKLARERGEYTRIAAAIADAKSKVRRLLNSSLVDDLL